MKDHTLNMLMMLLLLVFVLSGSSLAEDRQTYAAQGDAAFFKENGKIGLQATDGTILHAAEFDGAGYFDATQQANVYVDGKIGRIDRTGQIVVKPFECDEIEAIPTNSTAEDVPPYVLLVSWYGTDDEKVMQLMNIEGEWLSDTKFDLMLHEFENGKLFIRYKDQYNQIDTNGQLTSEMWWEYIFFAPLDEIRVNESFDRGCLFFDKHVDLWQHIVKQSDGRREIYLIQGEQRYLAPETWTEFKWRSDQFVAYCENDLWGIADYECNVIMPAQWRSAPFVGSLEEDIWRVTIPGTNRWQWVHSDGEIVLTEKPDETLRYESETRYTLSNDESTKLIDNTGKLIAEFDSKYFIKWFEEGQYFRYNNIVDDIWGFMSLDGDILSKFPDTLFEYRDGYTELTNGWFRVIDEERYEGPLDDPVGQCGFVNPTGDIVLSSEWDAAYDFTANMLARVEVDGRYGYVDTTGAYVIEPQWQYADDFMDAGDQWVAAVYLKSRSKVLWKGYINENNELVGENWF